MTSPANAGLSPDPAKIMQIGMGFWASKVLLTAVKLKLFTLLGGGSRSTMEIKSHYNMKTTTRHVNDWLDTLLALGFLERDGIGEKAVYRNSSGSDMFLDKNKPSYMGGILEMANNRLYRYWGELENGLITGKPQNESKETGNMDFFMDLYSDPARLQEFMDAMSSIQQGNFNVLTKKFDFSRYDRLADIGGADGTLSIVICRAYPEIRCTTFDLPPVSPLARKKIKDAGFAERIDVAEGDLMKDRFPPADVYTMGNIIHGLDEETKKQIIKKVYDVLPEGGVFITLENIIDDERKENAFGMMMSLNMLIENGDAFDYTFQDFRKWTSDIGFRKQELIPLTGPASAAIAYK